MKSQKLSFERAKKLFLYKESEGKIFWSDYALSESKSRKQKQEGLGSFARGYLDLRVDGRLYKVHRIIWLIHNGEFPENQIDHINGITTDNRISNLRDVTNQENQRNRGVGKNNKSGLMGVHFNNKEKRWIASITVSGKTIRGGAFKNKQDAIKKRIEMDKQYGFHKNHNNKKACRL